MSIQTVESSNPENDTMTHKILIVDDQKYFLSGLAAALKRIFKYPGEIQTVENGTEAIAEIRSTFYDICFLDLNLPDIYGLDVMKKVQDISPETKIVIMTADAIDEDLKKEVEDRVSLLISKPVDLPQIREFITKQAPY